MSDSIITSVVTVLMAIIGVAIIAVLVSKNANTSGVLASGGQSFAQSLGAATAPITGGGFSSFGLNFAGGGASF